MFQDLHLPLKVKTSPFVAYCDAFMEARSITEGHAAVSCNSSIFWKLFKVKGRVETPPAGAGELTAGRIQLKALCMLPTAKTDKTGDLPPCWLV